MSNIALDKKSLESVFALNHKDMTLIDIAGKHKSHETVLFVLDFCKENFATMMAVFGDRGTAGKNKIEVESVPSETTFQIKKVGYKELNKREEKFARTYFWASFYGQLDYVKKFMKCFGFSPFMKTYNR